MTHSEADSKKMINELYDAVLKAETREDIEALFSDLLTVKELEHFAQRIRAAKLILEGKTYQQIIDVTDISSATLSRVSRCVYYGSGGYRRFVDYDKSDK